MGSAAQLTTTRIELEARILVAALKQSIDQGDLCGADQAYNCLADLLRQRSSLMTEPVDGPAAEQASESLPAQAHAEQVFPLAATSEALPEPPLTASCNEAAQAAAGEHAEPLPVITSEPLPEPPPNCAKNEARPLFYETLQLDLLAAYKDIHVHFLRLVKQHIAARHSSEKSPERDFRLHLRSLCIAHDILKDPTTRRLYDLNVLGVHRASNAADARSFKALESAGVRIGELLQCAEILEPSELAIAVDMHKAMPEMMFGEFMVNQGFVSQPELDDTLLGQKLIEQAKLTVAQFQLAMQQARQRKTNLRPMLIEHQFVQEEDLL